MRHGEAENNVQDIASSDPNAPYMLTDRGRAQIEAHIPELKNAGVTRIITSPFVRTKKSAEIIAKALGLKIEEDSRIGELHYGDFSGKSHNSTLVFADEHMKSYSDAITGGESYLDAKRRFGGVLYEFEQKYKNEVILIASHGIASEVLTSVVCGADAKESKRIIESIDVLPGDLREFNFVPLPHNRDYELDYHLPYIDHIQLENEQGEPLTRIPEVVDCWVESGSMPFAEYHYPFENKEEFEKRTPSDFVSEYSAKRAHGFIISTRWVLDCSTTSHFVTSSRRATFSLPTVRSYQKVKVTIPIHTNCLISMVPMRFATT